MGKNLDHTSLVQRTGKLAFYQVNGVYHRMEGFTDLGYSKNPKEYSRQYVDEDFERSNVVGYSPSISFQFDKYKGNPVLEHIAKITEDELIGAKAVANIITVDMSTSQTIDGKGTAKAKLRSYAIIPDSFGDSTDCLTYSGNFKACGVVRDCMVSTNNDWQSLDSILFEIEKSATATVTVEGDGIQDTISVSGQYTFASGNAAIGSSAKIKVVPDFGDAYVIITKDSELLFNGSGEVSYTIDSVSGDSSKNIYNVAVNCGDQEHQYKIIINGV